MVPKNSGLEKYRDIALSGFEGRVIKVRGEDVPFWVDSLKEKAIGCTGEDLFYEYKLRTDSRLKTIRRIEWNDNKALFNKPTLCLLGKENLKPKTIAIPSKYKSIAERFLKRKGWDPKRIYLNGSVELAFTEGIADMVIDVVFSGNSLNECGLKILEKIFKSDFVIIGGKK